MRQWLRPSNCVCTAGVVAVTAALWQVGIGWALGWVGVVAIGVGAHMQRQGL